MKTAWQINWNDGMLLSADHFKLMESQANVNINRIINNISPNAWGISAFEFDDTALALGIVRIERCTGIFQDGSAFEVDSNDPEKPEASKFSNTNADIYLTYSNNDQILDNNQPIERIKSKLVLTDKPDRSFASIKIAEMEMKNNHITLNKKYIPPLLNIGASNMLMSLASNTLELLNQFHRKIIDSENKTISSNIKQYSAKLKVQLLNSIDHPYCLYKLVTELILFLDQGACIEVYQHNTSSNNIYNSCLALQKYLTINLPKINKHELIRVDHYWVCRSTDALLSAKRVIISIPRNQQHQIVEIELIKVANEQTIQKLIDFSISGIELKTTKDLPGEAFFNQANQYLEINISHLYWRQITEENLMAIYISDNKLMDELILWTIQ